MASSTEALRPKTPFRAPCVVVVPDFRGFSHSVWNVERWSRGAPKDATLAAYGRKLACAGGPGHREQLQRIWQRDRGRFNHERHRCTSGTVVEGRVSVFGGGLTYSGHYTSEAGIALNVAPGTEWGWSNGTTRGWALSTQRFRVTIAGRTETMPVLDIGPAGFTGRAIDVTEGGAAALGLSVSYFPTDSWGRAKLIPPRC